MSRRTMGRSEPIGGTPRHRKSRMAATNPAHLAGFFLRWAGRIGGMKLPQFSLADMLWTVGLLSVTFGGIGICIQMARSPSAPKEPPLIWIALFCQAPISLCAALGAPFRKKLLGALIGAGFVLLVAFWQAIR